MFPPLRSGDPLVGEAPSFEPFGEAFHAANSDDLAALRIWRPKSFTVALSVANFVLAIVTTVALWTGGWFPWFVAYLLSVGWLTDRIRSGAGVYFAGDTGD